MMTVSAQQLLDLSRENCDLKADVVRWQENAAKERARADALESCVLEIQRIAAACGQLT